MILDLNDEEASALTRLLSKAIDDDRYPIPWRIQTLKAILGKIRPEPVREPLGDGVRPMYRARAAACSSMHRPVSGSPCARFSQREQCACDRDWRQSGH